ncbi:MAG: prohibitin family protein [Oscillospiraceae bacterium]|nr:prohibitin family protein [Oscillospiraceae bacterium]
MNKEKGKRSALSILIAVFALVLVLSCFTFVPVGSTGVVKNLGAPSGKTFNNGLKFKVPFVQSVDIVDNKIQKFKVDADAVTSDLQEVFSTIAVNYRVNPADSVSIVRNIGALMYQDKILYPAVQESVKSVTAKYTAEGLITERAKVSAEIAKALEAKVNPHGISVQEFNIENFKFSEVFTRAIEEKQVAQQNLIKVRTQEEERVVKAEAQAKAAEAEAQAIRVRAEAQAEANRQLAASITATLVEYEKIQKWDGILPKVSGSGAIVDFRE